MAGADLSVLSADGALVWRVGRAPDPWAWVDRQYAGHNRWDDADSAFRTIYVADSLYACYVEVLAYARPDMNADGTDLLDGVRFSSRHGDELTMWAVFERPDDEPASRRLDAISAQLVDADDPDLTRAMNLHSLTWG